MKPSIPAACVVLLASIAILHGKAIKLSPEQAQRARAATELRFSYAASKDYDPYNAEVADAKKKCSDLMKQKAFASAIEEADRGLLADKYNIDLLIAKAAAYRALGNLEKAGEVRQQWMSLMDSILSGGDGRDFATAFRVISVDEEYAVLRVMQIERVTQSLVEHDGSQFDILSIKDPDSGKESQLYFNIDLPMKWLHAKFSQVGEPKPPGEIPPPAPAAVTPAAAKEKHQP